MSSDRSADAYGTRESVEEFRSSAYPAIRDSLDPTHVYDVGSNYGFISILCGLAFPQSSITCIEPDPRLIPIIESNLAANGITNAKTLNCICGDQSDSTSSFSMNPNGTQDNRVIAGGKSWEQVSVAETSIDKLCMDLSPNSRVLFKVDTQGYEERVLRGAETTLARLDKWLIKMEFAPYWLRSQDSDPIALLLDLVHRYQVCEWPRRFRFARDTVGSLLERPLSESEVPMFVNHIENLNAKKMGWCDLMVAPRQT